ncbi:MAG: SRPBCC family protein [Nitrososphaera sp.]
MRTFRHSFFVDAEIEKVWNFYKNIKHLEVITPPGLGIRVLKSTHQELQQGSEVWLTGKLVTRSNWHSRITALRPYEYVDEMISGRFKVWKHTHRFVDAKDGKTEVIDEIVFALHYGFIGRLFEGVVMNRLDRVFAHRKEATRAYFEKAR